VIKSIEGAFSEDDKAHFIREVQIMSQCRDKHITQFYGASLEPGRACLLMEHMERGSLYQVLEKPVPLPLQKQMALEIARGLQYLHTRGILHRDLKSANVLVNADNHAKLSDFGLSKTRATSVKTAKQKSEAIQWLPPECFTRGGVYTAQSDIYSYGVILWELVTGKRPYAGISDAEIPKRTLQGKRDTLDSIIRALC
jgi:serine/threonine protein kinase